MVEPIQIIQNKLLVSFCECCQIRSQKMVYKQLAFRVKPIPHSSKVGQFIDLSKARTIIQQAFIFYAAPKLSTASHAHHNLSPLTPPLPLHPYFSDDSP